MQDEYKQKSEKINSRKSPLWKRANRSLILYWAIPMVVLMIVVSVLTINETISAITGIVLYLCMCCIGFTLWSNAIVKKTWRCPQCGRDLPAWKNGPFAIAPKSIEKCPFCEFKFIEGDLSIEENNSDNKRIENPRIVVSTSNGQNKEYQETKFKKNVLYKKTCLVLLAYWGILPGAMILAVFNLWAGGVVSTAVMLTLALSFTLIIGVLPGWLIIKRLWRCPQCKERFPVKKLLFLPMVPAYVKACSNCGFQLGAEKTSEEEKPKIKTVLLLLLGPIGSIVVVLCTAMMILKFCR